MRAYIEFVLKAIDEVSPKLKEIQNRIKTLADTLNKSISKEKFVIKPTIDVSKFQVVYNEIQKELSKLRVKLPITISFDEAIASSRKANELIKQLEKSLEEIRQLKANIVDAKELANLTTAERKLENLKTSLEKLAQIDVFKNVYRANVRDVIEQIRVLKAELRQAQATGDFTQLEEFRERLIRIKEEAEKLKRVFASLPEDAQKHTLVAKAYTQLERNLRLLDAHFNKFVESAHLADNEVLKLWKDIGYLGLGFTVVFEAFEKGEEIVGEFVERVKDAIREFDDLQETAVKIAVFYNFFGTKTAQPISTLLRNTTQLTNELKLSTLYTLTSLDSLIAGFDELAQHSVFLDKSLIPAFASFADFTATIAKTTGSDLMQVRQEISALFEGTARAGNTLVRFIKRLEEINRIPKGTLEALQNASLPIDQFRIILFAVAKEWYSAQQEIFKISAQANYQRFMNTVNVLIQRTLQLFNIFKTGSSEINAFTLTWKKFLASLVDVNALQQSAQAYKRYIDAILKYYNEAIARGLSGDEAYKYAYEHAKRFYEEFVRLREKALQTPQTRSFETLVFQIVQLGQTLIELGGQIATAVVPVFTRILVVVNAFLNLLKNSHIVGFVAQLLTVAIAVKTLSYSFKLLKDSIVLATTFLARFLGLSSLSQLATFTLSIKSLAEAFKVIALSATRLIARIALLAGGFIALKTAFDYVAERIELFKAKFVKAIDIVYLKWLQLKAFLQEKITGHISIETRADIARLTKEISELDSKIRSLGNKRYDSFFTLFKKNAIELAKFVDTTFNALISPDKTIANLEEKLKLAKVKLPKADLPINVKLPPSDNLISNLEQLVDRLNGLLNNRSLLIKIGVNIQSIKQTLNKELDALISTLKQKLASIPKGSFEWWDVYIKLVEAKLKKLELTAQDVANKITNAFSTVENQLLLTGKIDVDFSKLLEGLGNIPVENIRKQVENRFNSLFSVWTENIQKRISALKANISLGIEGEDKVQSILSLIKAKIDEIKNSPLDIDVKARTLQKLQALYSQIAQLKYSFADLSNLGLQLQVNFSKDTVLNALQSISSKVHGIAISPILSPEGKQALFEQASGYVNQILNAFQNLKINTSNWRVADESLAKFKQLSSLLPVISQQIKQMDLPPILKEQALLRLALVKQRLQQIKAELQQQTEGWKAFLEPFVRFSSTLITQIEITKAYATAGANMFNAFVNSLASGFRALITGQANALKTFITSLGSAMLNILTQLIAKIMVIKALQLFAPGLLSFFQLAEGGILIGGFTPIKQFAEGGVVSRPTLGIIGEAGYPEAVIPLKEGYVPVKLTKPTSDNPITVVKPTIVNVVSPELVYEALAKPEGRELILNIIGRELGG